VVHYSTVQRADSKYGALTPLFGKALHQAHYHARRDRQGILNRFSLYTFCHRTDGLRHEFHNFFGSGLFLENGKANDSTREMVNI
jgi:hypothetical protein